MILNLLLSISFASTLIVKAPSANPHDFFVYTQNNEVEKISSHYLKCPEAINLTQKLKEAQFHFLNASLDKSRSLFKTIVDSKWNCDWKDEDKKIIAFSFYRLAQINPNEMEQIQLLTDAISFDDSSSPDEAIFPPPLVQLYIKLKSELKKRSFILPESVKNFSYILRNGQFISLASPVIETFTLRARYTFVSESYKTETLIVTPEELLQSDLTPQPLVEGDCNKYQLIEELEKLPKDSIKVFFSEQCVTDAVKVSAPLTANSMAAFKQNASGLPLNMETSVKKNWLQRNYLWVGAAVIGSLVIAHQIKQNNDRQTVVVPTASFNGN